MKVTTQLTTPHSDGVAAAIQEIDQELKQINESARALRSRRNALAPISSLPPEILSTIFMHTAAMCHSLAWIKVSHICRDWRIVALDCPCLWSNIVFHRPRWTHEMLKRSKMAPLDIKADLTFSTPRLLEIVQSTLGHLHRTRTLSITANHPTLINVFTSLKGDAPLLQSLSLRNPRHNGYVADDAFTVPPTIQAPRLRRLELLKCNVEWSSPFLRYLTHFKLHDAVRPSMTELLSALNIMPYLEILDLHNTLPLSESDYNDSVVRLDKLKQILLKDSLHYCAKLLAHLIYPASTALVLDCTFAEGDLQLLTRCLKPLREASAKPIHSLSLAQGGPTHIEVFASTSPSYIETGDSVHLDFSLSWDRVSDADVGTTQVISGVCKALKLSHLKTLYYYQTQDVDPSFWIDHFCKLPKLRNVTVSGTPVHSFIDALPANPDWQPRRSLRLSALGSNSNARATPALTAFPALRSLALQRVNVTETVDGKQLLPHLRDVLSSRIGQGMAVTDLSFEWCVNLCEADIEPFRAVVKDVHWDGMETLLNSDDEGLLFMSEDEE